MSHLRECGWLIFAPASKLLNGDEKWFQATRDSEWVQEEYQIMLNRNKTVGFISGLFIGLPIKRSGQRSTR